MPVLDDFAGKREDLSCGNVVLYRNQLERGKMKLKTAALPGFSRKNGLQSGGHRLCQCLFPVLLCIRQGNTGEAIGRRLKSRTRPVRFTNSPTNHHPSI
ncbi:MAG: hypothetical protein CMJ47_01525 [Planctomyces sp.]|nr:hypothetical protein [Planctomyces sp.]